MRPRYIFILMAASQRGNAGPRRRDLDWDIFDSDGLGIESGQTVPITDDYGSNLAFFDASVTGSSETGDLNLGAPNDYTFTLGDTGSEFSLGDWGLDSTAPENPYIDSSTDLDLFNSDYISDSGCSLDTMISGKARRDDSMCLNRGDVKTTPAPPTIPDLNPPVGPNQDPPWIKFFKKPDPPVPNQIPDPRFDNKEVEPPEVVPSTDIQGPCGWGFKYLCCELYGQLPPIMSDKPINECVRCMLSPRLLI